MFFLKLDSIYFLVIYLVNYWISLINTSLSFRENLNKSKSENSLQFLLNHLPRTILFNFLIFWIARIQKKLLKKPVLICVNSLWTFRFCWKRIVLPSWFSELETWANNYNCQLKHFAHWGWYLAFIVSHV